MKRIIALLLTIVIALTFLTSCSSTTEINSEKEAENSLIQSSKPFTDIKLNDYVECGKSDNLTLKFMPSTNQLMIENSLDGSVWLSNPQNPSEDVNAGKLDQMKMMSVLELEYANLSSKKRTGINIYTSNIKSGKYEIFTIQNGVVFKYNVTEVGKTLFLAAYLENGNFISEFWYTDSEDKKEDVAISAISVLPYFVRGSMQDEGYLFIPDGSGAIIDFSDIHYSGSEYQRNIFGYEPTAITSDYYLDVMERSICLPVYGAAVNGSAVMAICEDGAEYGVLSAEACGQSSSYARVYTKYTLLNSVQYNVGNYYTELFDQTDFAPNSIKTRYLFLSGENADYSGMARAYRNYILNENDLELKEVSNGLYADVYASIIKRVSTMGIPHNRTINLTDKDQLENMIKRLNSEGINDITVRYQMWNSDELKGSKIKTSSAASGISLKKIADIKGAKVYPALLNMQSYSNGGYFDSLINASKSITQLPFSWKAYTLSNLNSTKNTEYRVSLEWFNKNAPKLIEKLDDKGLKNIAFGDVSNSLYCDYKGEGYKRDKTMKAMSEMLSCANKKFDSVMLDSANAYAVPFADVIYNSPVDNSNHDIFSRSVPFYTIAISGIAQCVAPSYNGGGEDKMILNTVAAGAGFCVSWMSEKATELIGTELNNLSNVNFNDTFEDTLVIYKRINEVYSKVNGSCIYSHKYINDNVSVTEYENGLRIYVNFGKSDFVLDDGTLVSAENFIAKEGEQ